MRELAYGEFLEHQCNLVLIDDRELIADSANHYTEASLLTGEAYDTAARLCEEALALLPDADEARRCTLFSQLARAYMNLGDFDRTADYSRKGLALAEKLRDTKAQFALHGRPRRRPAPARTPARSSLRAVTGH